MRCRTATRVRAPTGTSLTSCAPTAGGRAFGRLATRQAICGNLLGLTHGSGWLPTSWLDRVEGIDLVRTVAADLWTEAHEPPKEPGDAFGTPAQVWFERYPGC